MSTSIADDMITVLCRPKELRTCMQVVTRARPGEHRRVQTVGRVEKRQRKADEYLGRNTHYVIFYAGGRTQRVAPNSWVTVTARSFYESLNMLGDQVLDWPLHHERDDGAASCGGKIRYITPGVSDVTTICWKSFYFDSPRELLQQVAQHIHDVRHEEKA